ncbi:hypothetical protein [Janthinobacterium sp. PAMC25594]|uniref:hypothetical protein n=1 Tax=Janthinobacterium sp. PAMC25594 TaxID=2861284 RepID=UPI001C638FE7|nr:hypothetical protein [Janthinobacterium sp. PAMC25594]QYG07833.1 hypothetical protein KY494_03195 [Janthinobacterium sp. PAMC25594]
MSAITNDDSGTFTINERRAAFTQAYDEEQAWRSQVVAQAMAEYNTTGKMTNFFKFQSRGRQWRAYAGFACGHAEKSG